MRGAGSIVMLVVFLSFHPSLAFLGDTEPDQIVNAHILFNLVILVAGIPLAGLVYRVSRAIVAVGGKPAIQSLEETEISALDESALHPGAGAGQRHPRGRARLRNRGGHAEAHQGGALRDADDDRIKALAALDDRIDRKQAAIKLSLAKVKQNPLTEDEARRCEELIGASVKLEQVGDIIVRNMLPQVRKKLQRGLTFTEQGWRELSLFHSSVLANARMAFNVLVSRDATTARHLVQEKDRLRELESAPATAISRG